MGFNSGFKGLNACANYDVQVRIIRRLAGGESCFKEYLIYLLTAIGLSPGGSSTVHIYTRTIHRTTQITNNLEECGPCPVFASFTLAFALQLRKKHGKPSVRVRENQSGQEKPKYRYASFNDGDWF